MLLILKMPVFLRKGGRNILNIYWIGKFITRETSPAQLCSAFLAINSSMGKMPQILTATGEKNKAFKNSFNHTNVSLYPLQSRWQDDAVPPGPASGS